MSWSLPVILKGQLSDTWARCLENLANRSVFPLSSYAFWEGKLANDHANINTPCQSWESVLSIMGEEDVIDQDGELKLHPIFRSLPPVMQLRFISFLQSNISHITCHAINTFLWRIETSEKNMWIKEAICQLRNAVAQCSTEASNFTELKSTKYVFTSESQHAFQAITKRLANRKTCPWQLCPASSDLDRGKEEAAVPVTNISTTKNTDSYAVRTHSDVSAENKTHVLSCDDKARDVSAENKTHVLSCDDKARDVIIIDDDSIDSVITVMDNSPIMSVNNMVNISKESFGNLPDKKNCDIIKSDNIFSSDLDKLGNRESKKLASDRVHLVDQQCVTANSLLVSEKPYPMNCELSPADSGIHSFATTNKLNERKRKFTEIVVQNEELEHSALKKCAFVNSEHEIDILDSAAELTSTQTTLSVQTNSAADPIINLPRNMVYLDAIREACSHKENAAVISKEIMDCFLDMDVAEIDLACTYLCLAHFSETALVHFCDSVPWSSLGSDTSSVLLNSCFSSKLRNLESPASRTLLMSLVSVSRIQPQTVINMLADILAVSKSGEFQCQVFTSICKEFLPLDCFEYLIQQLSKAAIVINEHLVSVLQTLVDRRPNLATESVHYLHSVLTATCHELSTSAKFGKLLMGVLTKYNEKMSNEQFGAMCALVETHNSSFRKPLLALVKRLTHLS